MGWLAVASGVVGTSYQLRRVRARGVEGVSLATWVLFVYMGCFWITYGFAARSAEVVLGSALILPIQLSILYRLAPWRRWAVPLRALGYFVLCCVAPTVLWGWAGGVFGTGVAMTDQPRPATDRAGPSRRRVGRVGDLMVRRGHRLHPLDPLLHRRAPLGRAHRDGLRRTRQPVHRVARDVASQPGARECGHARGLRHLLGTVKTCRRHRSSVGFAQVGETLLMRSG